ncbi:MAG: hypothetical protein MPK62_00595 [Alphaproteobacteria bacterium]|nr:hypothetical protein [Alphaproteobacteria bacterium]MDA8029636.1 hypothetical protein [Alphaproteobacteria bacterium]
MSRYDEYRQKVEQATKDGDGETAKFYTKRMRNIEKCNKWRENKKKEAAA